MISIIGNNIVSRSRGIRKFPHVSNLLAIAAECCVLLVAPLELHSHALTACVSRPFHNFICQQYSLFPDNKIGSFFRAKWVTLEVWDDATDKDRNSADVQGGLRVSPAHLSSAIDNSGAEVIQNFEKNRPIVVSKDDAVSADMGNATCASAFYATHAENERSFAISKPAQPMAEGIVLKEA